MLFSQLLFYRDRMTKRPSKVWFLPWGEKDRLGELLNVSGLRELIGREELVAVKTHFGEKGNDGYIRPKFFEPIIKIAREVLARPFLTDTNTIYHGERNNTVSHLAIAAEHGFSAEKLGVPVIIADGVSGKTYDEIEIEGRHFKKVKIARLIADADMIIAVSHFKGHLLAGFGGALKNLGMGCGARIGKFEMHSTVSPTISIKNCTGCGTCVEVCSQGALEVAHDKIKLDTAKCAGCGECIIACAEGALKITWSEPGKNVQEKFVEYAIGTVKDKKLFCVTFVYHITPNCDCVSFSEKPMVGDIGILASTDPVAIDQAALDLVLKASDTDILKKAHPNIDYEVQLVYAQKMGLGTRSYEIIYLP